MSGDEKNERIWKALSDASRREMLDVLADGPRTTGELVAHFEGLCRTNVMKHLDVLVKANLVIIRREGRSRWNYLNPVPIERVCNRWVSRHVKKTAAALSRLKDLVEGHGGEAVSDGKEASKSKRSKATSQLESDGTTRSRKTKSRTTKTRNRKP